MRHIRTYYNESADAESGWHRVRWCISTSTEPGEFLPNRWESPFNIGLPVTATPFNLEEVAEFALRCGFADAGLARELHLFLGGRTNLTHRALYHHAQGKSINELFDIKTLGASVFGDHLCRYLKIVQTDADLLFAIRCVLEGQLCRDARALAALEGIGLIRCDLQTGAWIVSCNLYAAYYRDILSER